MLEFEELEATDQSESLTGKNVSNLAGLQFSSSSQPYDNSVYDNFFFFFFLQKLRLSVLCLASA